MTDIYRFGEVWRGTLHGEKVAVKIFASREEVSWRTEAHMYNNLQLRHENIVGFIAADMTSRRSCTQLWLIVQYHAHGSLYDFLKLNSIGKELMFQLAYTAAAGLQHLHTEITGVMGKPAIAHRDIKLNNLIVHSHVNVFLIDFGFSRKFKQNDETLFSDYCGTLLYMAPELLQNKPYNGEWF